jgi:hypothetical protein
VLHLGVVHVYDVLLVRRQLVRRQVGLELRVQVQGRFELLLLLLLMHLRAHAGVQLLLPQLLPPLANVVVHRAVQQVDRCSSLLHLPVLVLVVRHDQPV